MKKLLCLFFSLVFALSFAGCADRNEEDEKLVVSRVTTAENGYTYLEVDGSPFPYFGVESRLDAFMNCEKKPVEEFEPHMKAAAELGATVVAVPIDWRDLEPEKDDYDFRMVAAVLEYANKYDVKVEFLWYSVNMCGDSNSYQIPRNTSGRMKKPIRNTIPPTKTLSGDITVIRGICRRVPR